MPEMTDPTPAMVSFQRAVLSGGVSLQKSALYSDVFFYGDALPNGSFRFTYVQMSEDRVLAFANFVPADYEDGLPVFQVEVAVPAEERGKGRAKLIVSAGIAEMKHGFNRVRREAMFYVEAIVDLSSIECQNVMAATISKSPKQLVGQPSLIHYMKKF